MLHILPICSYISENHGTPLAALLFKFFAMPFSYLLTSLFLLFTLSSLVNTPTAQAQGQNQTIKFSGLIVEGDSAYGIPGVHVAVPRAGRGTVTNNMGYFSLFVKEGDSVVISAIGYKDVGLRIPRREKPLYSVVVDMKEEAMQLAEVEVFPYATEEIFKEAFLALELPNNFQLENMKRNLDQREIARIASEMPMTSTMNHRWHMDQQVNATHNRNFATSIPLLNPFAWAELIKSIKRGDFKKKDD